MKCTRWCTTNFQRSFIQCRFTGMAYRKQLRSLVLTNVLVLIKQHSYCPLPPPTGHHPWLTLDLLSPGASLVRTVCALIQKNDLRIWWQDFAQDVESVSLLSTRGRELSRLHFFPVNLNAPCGNRFKGFMLQARRTGSDQALGSFNTPSGSKIVSCGSSQVTVYTSFSAQSRKCYVFIAIVNLNA